MNFMSLIAFLFAGTVLWYGVFSSGNSEVFINLHAILIVIGGTIAAAAISFQVDRIFLLFGAFFRRVILGRKLNYVKIIEDIIILADIYRTRQNELDKAIQETSDPFLKESMTAIVDQVLNKEQLLRVLRMRVNTIYQRQVEEMMKFRTVGKYPPAFGLMGTTLSMITLLQKLGQSGGQKMIGPSMAIGLVATFYGLALANLVFNPVSENLHDSARETRLKNMIIVEGIRLILENANALVLAEELNSFLLENERVDWKKTQARKAA